MQFNFASGDREPIVREWPTTSMEQVVRAVCRECNNGWMSDLEGAAMPFVLPMMHLEPIKLDEAAQEAVAAWSVKTALMLSLTLPHRLIDKRFFSEFYESRNPPGFGVVYLSSFAGEAMSWYHVHGMDLFETESQQQIAHGWVVSFILGNLAVQFTGNDYSAAMTLSPDNCVRMGLIQIAPLKHSTRRWPPLMQVHDSSLGAFARMMLASDDELGPSIAWVDVEPKR